MKNIKEYLTESFERPFELNDEFTREYNNLFGMMSNTLLRKCCPDCDYYVLTGSACRDEKFLFNDLEYTPDFKCPADFFEKFGMEVYNSGGQPVLHNESDPLDEECMIHCAECVKDRDYLIVCSR